jgi:hypothetical protein
VEWLIIALVCLVLVLALGSYRSTAARIGRIEHKINLMLRHHQIDPLQGRPLSDRVKRLADDSAKKIAAIKVYREETGASLAEAKEAVEAYLDSK